MFTPPQQVRKGDKLRLYNKGAAEWVLRRSVAFHNERGEVVTMTEAARESLMQVERHFGVLGCWVHCLMVTKAVVLLGCPPTSNCAYI